MNLIYRILLKFSKFLLFLIPINFKKNHKFLNKNHVINTEIILSLLKEKINPEHILDIGCSYGELFLKCINFFSKFKIFFFDGNNINENKLSLLKKLWKY